MANQSPSSYLWPNGLTLILGVWLFISPWVLANAPGGNWAWDAWIVGAVVALLSIAALVQLAQWEDWVSLILGAWLFISPWVLGFYASMHSMAWNAYIIGALIFLIGIWGVVAARQAETTMHLHAH
ncbi:MAG: hypothetical protein EPN45_13340 [Rhizobiaceae bacterium]|jgi:hypothetical protein|nr:MAG: hypothetical protein EPN45_13340 [Rhizobiaceae bacterium]